MLGVQRQAIMCHQTMLANIAQQMALQAKTAGVSSSVILRATQGDYAALIVSAVYAPLDIRVSPQPRRRESRSDSS
jgi:hypothetical protein